MSTTTNISLRDKWIQFHKENPRVRIRDAARQLETSEAEILAAFAGSSVIHLNTEFAGLWKRLPQLGYVMVLTRNESCVHERKGIFEEVSVNSKHVGVVVGKDIDLRMLFHCWAFAFAVFDNEEAAFKRSIQLFDHQGVAIIKIYLQPNSDETAFDHIVRDFQQALQPTSLNLLPAPEPPVYANETADVPAFLQAWSELKDTHDFFPLLRKYNISRHYAVQVAGEFAKKVNNESVKLLLEHASNTGMEIMVFVANHGNIQIHTGPVNKIVEIPGWINVMDPAFNLHLRLDHIAETWAVKKPTSDGPVHSLEIFDATGELIVQFFGKRKPGAPELTEWTRFINTLQ
jgi:putative hemin transport protein